MADDREPYALIALEAIFAWAAEQPFGSAPWLHDWVDLPPPHQEALMRAASAVRDAVLNSAPAGAELVRETWVYWALEQPDVAEHPNWLKSWAEIDERDREVDDRIYSAVATKAVHDAGLEAERLRMQLFALGAHLPAIRRALTIAITEAEYEAEKKPYRAALHALDGQERSDEKEPRDG